MTVFIEKSPAGTITLRARAVDPDTGMKVDLIHPLRRGEEAFRRPYEFWAAAEGPTVEIDD